MAVVLAVIVTAVPVTTDAASPSFTDVKPTLDHYDSIMDLAGRGIVKGYSDGTYRPDSRLTRGQASKILALALKLDTKNVKNPGFKDVDKANGFYKYVAALENARLISGFEDHTFKPNAFMTRAHMAKAIDLGFKLEGKSTVNPFIDVSDSAWYVDHVKALVSNKVTKGKTATTFDPNASITRAQMASFVIRAENIEVVTTPIDEARAKIRKVVTQNGVIEVGGKKVAESKFTSRTNTVTMTAYDSDEGIKGITGIGVFSAKLRALGVNNIRIGNAKAVDLSQSTAKDALKDDFLNLLKPSTKPSTDSDVSAEGVQVTLYADKDGIQFRETFNVDFHVFVPSTK
ncbi:S-layer homology domain-containing protein [Sporosarcina sp. E16_3]|uniref:S-layer homology domain-containing protein n=1 Tax=Sporosarcina sp. E16_3 TaxID=2789293 RepID=UPI001A930C75|nr:S-layer homology domain-containing protein [Sporosarcina sp. E16_3]